MPKNVLADNYVKAFNVLYKKMQIVNTVELTNEDEMIILTSNSLTPERLLIKRQQFNNLSIEAKEVIQLIINTPSEIIELLTTPKQKRITKVRLKKYLKTEWHSEFIVDETIKELEEWIKQL